MTTNRRLRRIVAALLLSGLSLSACVTRTERVGYYPYAQREDESIWREIQRELGWQTTVPREPFYKRAGREVKEAIAGWFRKAETHLSPQELEESRQQFEQKREEAFRHLRERQEQEQKLGTLE